MRQVFKPAFSAWIVTWAVTTFASAAFRTEPIETSMRDWMRRWFDVADAIPPFAKIAFGITLAIGFRASGKTRFPAWAGFVVITVIMVGAFMLATLVYPLQYYESFYFISFWPYHFLSAIIGATIGCILLYRARKNEHRM